ncbi:MAG: carbohydrate porin [Candidatus Omnitrophota bacterium]
MKDIKTKRDIKQKVLNAVAKVMCKRLFSGLLIYSFFFLFSDFSFAKSVEDEIEELKTRIAQLERQVSKRQDKLEEQEVTTKEIKESFVKYTPGEGAQIQPAGLNISAGVTFVFQGTPNANNASDGEDSIFDGSWSMDIEIEKEFDDWGLAFLHLETGQNDTVEGELSLFSNVNRDADASGAAVNVTEAWYEHYFFNEQLTLTGGKIDATSYLDQNEYANDERAQFLGHIFRNSPTIEWPSDNNLGARAYVCVEPIQFLEFETGYFEADGDWDDIFDHAFYMAQVNLKLADLLGYDPEQFGGNYRFYTWINDRFHEKLVDEGGFATDDCKEMNYGFGISCDQMITDVFGIFGRYGWQRPDIMPVDAAAGTPPDIATIEYAWSSGIRISGKYWNRNDDILAFAIGQAFSGDEYDDAGGGGSAEGHIETYYSLKLNECLTVSPDFQVIWDPNGISKPSEGDDDTIFVYGMRGQIDF